MTVAESGIREWERDLVVSRGSCSGQDRQSDPTGAASPRVRRRVRHIGCDPVNHGLGSGETLLLLLLLSFSGDKASKDAHF